MLFQGRTFPYIILVKFRRLSLYKWTPYLIVTFIRYLPYEALPIIPYQWWNGCLSCLGCGTKSPSPFLDLITSCYNLTIKIHPYKLLFHCPDYPNGLRRVSVGWCWTPVKSATPWLNPLRCSSKLNPDEIKATKISLGRRGRLVFCEAPVKWISSQLDSGWF